MAILGLLLLGSSACESLFRAEDFTLPDITFDIPETFDPTVGKGLGEPCSDASALPECRFGLSCVEGTCQTTGATAEGRPCILTAECLGDLYCGLRGLCEPAGEGEAGTPCVTSGQCVKGLVCELEGLAGECRAAGDGDLEASCERHADCLAGLACHDGERCGAGSPTFGWTPWPGVSCAPDGDPGPPRPYFEIPRRDGSDGDFFRLPFPSDVRRSASGRLDLEGFPSPGPGAVGFDIVERLKDAAERELSGFSTAPVIHFRFSAPFDLGSIWADGIPDPPSELATLYFLDITPSSPTFNLNPAFSYFMTDGGTRYVCPRYLAIRPAWDTPLRPATTYAIILAEGILDAEGAPLVPDDDLALVLGDAPPEGPRERAAWDAFAPLRDYLEHADAKVAGERIISATVFTTLDTERLLPRLREAVHALPPATPSALTLCDAGVTSPCDDGLGEDEHVRGCFGADGAFHELHLRLPIPRIQTGERPYLEPADLGHITEGPDGAVQLHGEEQVCLSLTIPRGLAMPAEGWPVAIYGHGTGGTFRSAVRDLGGLLAHVDTDDGPVGVAVVGWEGPMHGERRGDTTQPPELLFYNFANPRAARGNLYQGATDVFTLVRALKALEIPADESPTGEAIRFDANHLAHVGHSQGGTTGPLASAFEDDVGLDVWSGAGAGLVLSLLAKKSPVDIPSALSVALQELGPTGLLPVNDLHPVMNLVQALFDEVDPLNHAHRLMDRPHPGHAPHHILQLYGLGDTFTPPATIETFGRLMRLHVAMPVLKAVGLQSAETPVSGNVPRGAHRLTAVQLQAEALGYDGHFILSRDPDVRARLAHFIASWVAQGTPTLLGPGDEGGGD